MNARSDSSGHSSPFRKGRPRAISPLRRAREARVDAGSAERIGASQASSPPGQILREIYRRLLCVYGPQHWWPADEPFEVTVGAILTQSTAWANVVKAIRNLKAADAMSPQALRRLSVAELEALIRPSGYYTVKTHKLKALVSWVGAHDDDLAAIFVENTEQLREELLAVYGIGEETADSILLYAAGRPVFVIDAYTRRLVDRVGIPHEGAGYSGYQRLFSLNLPPDAAMFNEYHALIVEHGKRTCRKMPLCLSCLLLDVCEYGLSQTAETLLIQGARKQQPGTGRPRSNRPARGTGGLTP